MFKKCESIIITRAVALHPYFIHEHRCHIELKNVHEESFTHSFKYRRLIETQQDHILFSE